MKKTFILTALLSFAFWGYTEALTAQIINTPLIASFETEADNPFDFSFDSMDGTVTISNNPETSGVNSSLKCAVYENTTGTTQAWWGKIFLKPKAGITIQPASNNHKFLTFYVYTTDPALGAEIRITDISGVEIFKKAFALTASNKWEKLVFDLGSAIQGKSIGDIYIAPAVTFGEGMHAGTKYMIDEITLSDIAGEYYDNPVLVNFEDEFVSPFTARSEAGVASVNNNTLINGINNSAKCFAVNYPGGFEWWQKIRIEAKSEFVIIPQSESHKYLHFMIHRGNTEKMFIEIYNKAGKKIYRKHYETSISNTWSEVILDLSASEKDEGDVALPGIVGENIGQIWIIPIAGGGTAGEYLFDNFVLSDSADPIGQLTEVTNLGNFETGEGEVNCLYQMKPQTVGATATIEENPLPTSDLNKTTKVIKYVRPTGGEIWHSLMLLMDGYIGIVSPNNYLHFMMYNPGGTDVTVIVKDAIGAEIHKSLTFSAGRMSAEAGWVDHVISLGTMTNIASINFRIPDAGTYYIDEMIIDNNSEPRLAIPTNILENTEKLTITTGNGMLKVASSGLKTVDIYSVCGILVAQEKTYGKSEIQVELPKGTYIIKTGLSDGTTDSRKVVL